MASDSRPDRGHLERLPDRPYRFIAVDVETAGKTIAGICQIGLCGVGLDNSLHTASVLVDPEEAFEPFNTRLHGIDAACIAGAATFPQAYGALFEILNAHHLVQHSRYDEKAFSAACARYNLNMVSSHWTDSVAIARRAWPALKANGGHGLGNLKEHLGLAFHHHDAGKDARAAAMVVLQAEGVLGGPIRHLRGGVQLKLNFDHRGDRGTCDHA